jgi:L-aminopeptidase/D-esterase-like protein
VKGLTDIPGIQVGHASNFEALTGCTAILCEGGAVAGIDIRGGASGTEEAHVLSPLHVTDRIHAVLFSGGSAFGLEAASGVRRFLERKGIGFPMSSARVPLVACAILYDLGIGKADVRPTREMGEVAAAAASTGAVKEGAVGAGTGASVGKALGIRQGMKSGLGSASTVLEGRYSGVRVAALAAVNAYGDVIDPTSGKILAGARTAADSREFADGSKFMKRGGRPRGSGENTTLVVVATNAKLTKVGATKLAQFAHQGLIRAISPVNTMMDGDLVVALSLGDEHADVNALGVAAAEIVAESIVRAVKLAPSLGGLPGLKDWA